MLAGVSFVVLFALAVSAQEPAPRRPQKGDTVIAVGCMKGSALEAQETRLATAAADDDSARIEAPITYRLTGDKELLKQLKAAHSSHLEEITGVLKSRLPDERGRGKQLGRTGIYVGLGTPNASQPPALPVLEITSFKHLATDCR
jgi:hypothetical protein